MKRQLINMINVQENMNRKVHPEWRVQEYQWRMAIMVEAAELLEHYGWKWWKQQRPNLDQVHLEMVDVFHFMLSWSMENGDPIKPGLIAEEIIKAMSRPVSLASSFQESIQSFVSQTMAMDCPRWAFFAGLMQKAGLSFDRLYLWYMGKNALNMLRQDCGYKYNNYMKIWHGREDNEYLADILNNCPTDIDDPLNAIYNQLSTAYRLACEAA